MVGLTFLNLNLDGRLQLEDNFATRWNAARSWMREGLSPYSEETQQATVKLLRDNNDIANERDRGNFLDPAWYVFLFIPISFIPYPIAKAIWMMLSQLSVVVSILLALDLSGLKLRGFEILITCVLVALAYPMVRASLTASMAPIFIMLSLLAIRQGLKGDGNQAGILLLFAIWINPIAIFPAVFLLIVFGTKRDNSLGKILLFGFLFLMITSLILFPSWIPDWFSKIVLLNPEISWLDTPWMGVARAFPGAYAQIAIVLHLVTFIMILAEWFGLGQMNERQLQWKLMLTLTIAYFFNLFSEGVFLLMVLPAFFSIYKYISEKWLLSGKIIYWISEILICVLSWKLMANPLTSFPKEHPAIVLFVPIIIIFALQYFRWWALASPKALVESKK